MMRDLGSIARGSEEAEQLLRQMQFKGRVDSGSGELGYEFLKR